LFQIVGRFLIFTFHNIAIDAFQVYVW